ncbi:MAG: sugar phosphate isomerase/epimerase [Kiritimatiellae bacterium]|nr:sugar phosphate isomerase/epimerase [Kiritimatiellia bacterium]
MKLARIVPSLLLAATLLGCCCPNVECRDRQAEEPNISVFASFIRKTAKERGISLSEAAEMLHALGVRGFDAGADDADLPQLAATSLKPINFYFFPKMYSADNGAADCKRCLDRAVKYGVPRVMVVPSHFTKNGNEAEEFAKDLSSMKMFVAEGKKRGITITIEDFGGPVNPGSHTKYLKRFLDEIPDLRFALDSGNLYYAGRGESILDMMDYAKGRIEHVHLKDQTKEDNRKYATLGLGAVPNEKIVKTVAASGYKGWYTLENAVGDDTYTDTVRQVAVLKSWLDQANGKKRK